MSHGFSALLRKLSMEEPAFGELRQASVAVILRGKDEPSLLLIKRADREDDPWSGQVAFPGGKVQQGDATLRDTAVRESKEEVGIDLDASAEFLGYFTSFRTHTGTMDVVPSAFLVNGIPQVRANEEVASYRWVELGRLRSGQVGSTYKIEFGGQARDMPAFLIDDYVVWGLTHRIISALLE